MPELTQLCLAFLLFIDAHSHYPAVADCPRMELVSEAALQQRACAGRPCPALAFYERETKTVLLFEQLDLERTMARSILLHETVHYVQDVSGRWREDDDDCRAGMKRELYAFQIQEKYLLSNDVRVPVSQNMMFYRC